MTPKVIRVFLRKNQYCLYSARDCCVNAKAFPPNRAGVVVFGLLLLLSMLLLLILLRHGLRTLFILTEMEDCMVVLIIRVIDGKKTTRCDE